MTIHPNIVQQFRADVAERGLRYFKRGAAKLQRVEPDFVFASVSGSREYEVMLTTGSGDLGTYCTCPYFRSYGLCKHVFATLLSAKATGTFHIPEKATIRQVSPFDDEEEDDTILEGPWGRDDRRPAGAEAPRPSPPLWEQALGYVEQFGAGIKPEPKWPVGREVFYILDTTATKATGKIGFELACRRPTKSGAPGRLKEYRLPRRDADPLPPDLLDREILALFSGAYDEYGHEPFRAGRSPRCTLRHSIASVLLPMLARSGRLMVRPTQDSGDTYGRYYNSSSWGQGYEELIGPLAMDEGEAWQLKLRVGKRGRSSKVTLEGFLARGSECMELSDPVLLLSTGWLFTRKFFAGFDSCGAFSWVHLLRENPSIEVPAKQVDRFLNRLLSCNELPALETDESLRVEEVALPPALGVRIGPPETRGRQSIVTATVAFRYGKTWTKANDTRAGLTELDADGSKRRLFRRDRAAETAAMVALEATGFKRIRSRYGEEEPQFEIAAKRLPATIRSLLAAGWHVEAEGIVYRTAGAFDISVSSGIDWFELHGGADFDGIRTPLPRLLSALRRGESTISLDDGSFGVLPEEWLARIRTVAEIGKPGDGDSVRFERCQAAALDALLAAQPEATCDATFARIRKELESFDRIAPAVEPKGFNGKLRPYQRDGLAWLHFLMRFKLGGCLADDMGLGKTVQVLALLEDRRARRREGGQALDRPRGPSLVVAPRSLIHNWIDETKRFSPKMRVLAHTGPDRPRDLDGLVRALKECDLLLTTYGTMRRDAAVLKDVEFDFVVLDESQAIKNARTAAAKAARLLNGTHRLALSGTPIENHLGELWSLFEFLNPGMLGSSSVFSRLAARTGELAENDRTLLARALKPMMLRRTKGQVAKDLPPKTEQTIHCELDARQRKLYDELRDHYRSSLLPEVGNKGPARSKIQVLEALLRLRQAACHPGLIDRDRVGESSAKLEALLAQLDEALAENHKALVFSQFTSLLRIVRDRLDAKGIPYEYLDGRTRNRAERVERFQSDPDCRLFLVSIKAGGLGLNLTAAEYVFLLDPWWNPAVESQAIDRAHRIGQTRPVFAYRLIARDTVEEKVIELQERKRSLADAIITADRSVLRDLTSKDLEMLLS